MKLVHAAVAATAAAVLAMLPAAAQANSYTYADQTGDVVSYTPANDATSPAPAQVEGDIVWSKVRHRARKVVLTMRLRELSTTNPSMHWYGIRTGKMKRFVLLEAAPGHWSGRVALFTPNGKRVRCNVTRSIDYTANTATVAVPRSCLGKPRWVKVAMQEASPGPDNTLYIDDARSNGGMIPVYGPRVYR